MASHLPDLAEKLVTQPFAPTRPPDQPGDIDELHCGGHDSLGFRELDQGVETGLRHGYDPEVRIDGAEGVVLGGGVRLRQRAEERRLPDVRQADDPEAKHGLGGRV